MTKAELIRNVAEDTNQTQISVKHTLDEIIEAITTELMKGEKVQLVGFGTFQIKRREAKIGRNPRTGEEIKIPARFVPTFKPGKELKDAIKG